jgi:hypothetical protein
VCVDLVDDVGRDMVWSGVVLATPVGWRPVGIGIATNVLVEILDLFRSNTKHRHKGLEADTASFVARRLEVVLSRERPLLAFAVHLHRLALELDFV